MCVLQPDVVNRRGSGRVVTSDNDSVDSDDAEPHDDGDDDGKGDSEKKRKEKDKDKEKKKKPEEEEEDEEIPPEGSSDGCQWCFIVGIVILRLAEKLTEGSKPPAASQAGTTKGGRKTQQKAGTPTQAGEGDALAVKLNAKQRAAAAKVAGPSSA
jgi:hypothetical protein